MMAGLVENVSGRTLLVVDVVENMEENYCGSRGDRMRRCRDTSHPRTEGTQRRPPEP